MDAVRSRGPRLRERVVKVDSWLQRFRLWRVFGKVLVTKAPSYVTYAKRYPIDSRLVFYESHFGAGMLCNPFAIFEALRADPKYSRLKHVWVINTQAEIDYLATEYDGHRNVRFVLRDSKPYAKALATAKYIINNTSYPAFFSKRSGQICVNTWHSTTVKTIGYDLPDGNIQIANMIRSLLASDYVISPNTFMTGIFRDTFKLQGLFRGKVLELGYPRNDLTARTDREKVLRDLRARGVDVDPTKKIILFAPTWRGASVGAVDSDISSLIQFREEVSAQIDLTEYQILIKAHHLVDRKLSTKERAAGNYVPRQIDTNELLAAVDVLVSDYSSIYFDFMVTDRPVLFYIPDKETYDNNRGVYFGLEELPGPATADLAELSGWINDIDRVAAEFADRYAEVKAWACAEDDGHSAERVVKALFGADHSVGVVDDFLAEGKKRILFHASRFSANGVSAALKALLERIDRDEFDVTVFGVLGDDRSRQNWRSLSGVRTMPRVGDLSYSRWEAPVAAYALRHGLDNKIARFFRAGKIFQRELRRCFGDAEFDYLIDFSGYGQLFPSVIRQSSAGKKIIWQHTELAPEIRNEAKRKLRGARAIRFSIPELRDTYAAFDKVVSCSEQVMIANRREFSLPETFDNFTYVNNLIDIERVLSGAAAGSGLAVEGHIAVKAASDDNAAERVLIPDTPPAPDDPNPYVKFVTMGRLSPEKNQANLITAFARFIVDYPNTRLYVVGGGELEDQLANQVTELGLADRVTITGHLENPFAVLKHGDCFVFPSTYEGQGLAVHEARVLGLPIILANYPAAGSVAVADGQYLVGFSADEIYEGLVAYMKGEVPKKYHFDADDYNDRAYAQFLNMLSAA